MLRGAAATNDRKELRYAREAGGTIDAVITPRQAGIDSIARKVVGWLAKYAAYVYIYASASLIASSY